MSRPPRPRRASATTPLALAVVPTTVTQTYHDFLPALNMVVEPSDQFLIRFNAAQVMARPI